MMDYHINAENVIREIAANISNRVRKAREEISVMKIVIELLMESSRSYVENAANERPRMSIIEIGQSETA